VNTSTLPVPDPVPAPGPDSAPNPIPGHAEPVSATERIATLDVLRGLAILGILVMNIQVFAMPMAAYSNPLAYGSLEGLNRLVWDLSYLFANLKFVSLFSMLFGAGIVLMLDRAEAKGELRPGWLHVRRMMWLLLFGLIHAYLLWAGDILVPYATVALLIFPLRKARPAVLIACSVVLVTLGSLINILGGWSMAFWPDDAIREFLQEWRPDAKTLDGELSAYRGNWLQQMPYRAEFSFFMQVPGFFFFTLWRCGGLMLLGMALVKTGFLRGTASARSYWTVLLGGGALGMALTAVGIQQNFAHQWDMGYSFFFGTQWVYWGSLFVALAYAAGIALLVRSRALPSIAGALGAVGRMAFSNYILQTVVCTAVFYGHGLGLFGYVDRVGQMGVVLAVWALNITVSLWWLSRHRYGPLEWLWRRLTYGSAAIAGPGKVPSEAV
jgi:uncharacterized protein